MKKIILVIFTILSLAIGAHGQQDPIYAQYLINPLLINPAYAGNNNMFNATIQYRTQWAGIDANPVTMNFSSHMAVAKNKVGVGVMASQDRLGDTKNTEFNAMYSYKIQVNNTYISFGLQTGFIRYTSDGTGLTIRDPGDPSFIQLSETSFNTGAGILVKNDKFMVGLSAPRLLPATVSLGGQKVELYKQHYYLFGSYIMFISDAIRFKPSVLLRGTQAAPFSTDVNLSFNIKELYTAGIFTRNFGTYGLLMQAFIKNIRLGYVVEVPGSSTSSLNFTSHEFSLGISTALLSGHDKTIKTF